ncbi:hypothetical protein [Singulisphaera sp. PoT]|uniref:hypothetical protein n=1 Tax=Singulisphaera sp. PoT TaxID=3411797 RepID=UPI003BF4B1E0
MYTASVEPAIADTCARSFLRSLQKAACGILGGGEALKVHDYRRVERLMRIAIALGTGQQPYVQVHGLPPGDESSTLPETFEVKLTNLLAAKASEVLSDAVQGAPEALARLDSEAEQILATEDIQLV